MEAFPPLASENLRNLDMAIFQKEIQLQPVSRGFHLITDIVAQVVKASNISEGLCHVFIQHTSASLTINENADPTVRADFESYFSRLAKEDEPYYLHNYEGSDDMPAHLKASMLGSSVSMPISRSSLNLGTWQGVYLCEHRDRGGSRRIVVTIYS